MGNRVPRVRFAPSPTGHLHIGGARQAVFNWLFAKANNGVFLLRIEDTDVARSKDEYKNSIIAALSWLGLTIDEEVVIQSQNQAHHSQVATMLVQNEIAYKCYCSSEALQEMREGSTDNAFRYPGVCRPSEQKPQTENQIEKPYVIRFKLPATLPQTLTFTDAIKGEVSIEANTLDDFVIVKSDGIATYNFAVVLDDISMNITHVLRGEDHVINTFKQILLYKALGEIAPVFAHAPMILGPNGERLSKRHGATAVIDYRDIGILPEALFNYLVRLGWSHGDDEIFSREELCKIFSIEAIGKKNGIFDLNKLLWFNTVYIKKLSLENFLEHLSNIKQEQASLIQKAILASGRETITNLFTLFQPRSTTILELANQLEGCLENTPSVLRERISLLTLAQQALLKSFLTQATQEHNTSAQKLQMLAKELAMQTNNKLPELAKPLRLLLSGQMEGASAFALAEIFGTTKLQALLSVLTG